MVSLAEELDDQKNLTGLQDHKSQVLAALPALKTRAKTVLELISGADFIFGERPLQFEDKAANAVSGDALDVLKKVEPVLSGLNDWSHDGIDGALRKFAEENELKFGKVAQPLRAAVTAKNCISRLFRCPANFGQRRKSFTSKRNNSSINTQIAD